LSKITRKDLLKLSAVSGTALALGMPSPAGAQEIPHHAFAEGYLTNADLGFTLLVQAAAPNVPVLGPTDAPAPLASPGTGFDVDLAEAVVGNNKAKNKGQDPSWCIFKITHGALNGLPPVNSGGTVAVRLEGFVEDATDPANLGVPIKVLGSSGAPVTGDHPICGLTLDFGGFLFTGIGLLFVNH
jgi:hypothetical protein